MSISWRWDFMLHGGKFRKIGHDSALWLGCLRRSDEVISVEALSSILWIRAFPFHGIHHPSFIHGICAANQMARGARTAGTGPWGISHDSRMGEIEAVPDFLCMSTGSDIDTITYHHHHHHHGCHHHHHHHHHIIIIIRGHVTSAESSPF